MSFIYFVVCNKMSDCVTASRCVNPGINSRSVGPFYPQVPLCPLLPGAFFLGEGAWKGHKQDHPRDQPKHPNDFSPLRVSDGKRSNGKAVWSFPTPNTALLHLVILSCLIRENFRQVCFFLCLFFSFEHRSSLPLSFKPVIVVCVFEQQTPWCVHPAHATAHLSQAWGQLNVLSLSFVQFRDAGSHPPGDRTKWGHGDAWVSSAPKLMPAAPFHRPGVL